MTGGGAASPPDPDDVLELFLGFWISRSVMAATQLGVFELCEAEALTADDLGGALALPERSARALLDTCVATGLLTKDSGYYRNSALASAYLRTDSEYSLRNYVLDERWCWAGWGRLEEALRTGTQQVPEDEEGYHAFPEDFFLDFLHGHSLVMGERLAAIVDLGGVTRIMDVGGGSGAVSIALCRANPALAAVVVDQAPVTRRAAGHIDRAGLSERITTVEANVFSDVLPGDCDAAVIANLLHDFSPERAREILARVAAALPTGGRVLVLEIAPDDDRRGPPLAVAFSVAMIVNTAGGDAHTPAQYRDWLETAGFTDVRAVPVGGRMVTTVFEATRAG